MILIYSISMRLNIALLADRQTPFLHAVKLFGDLGGLGVPVLSLPRTSTYGQEADRVLVVL